MTNSKIAIAASTSSCQSKAEQLAEELDLPFAELSNKNFSFLLVATPEYLELRDSSGKLTPLFVDFFTSAKQQRFFTTHLQGELISRAVGIKSDFRPTVIDATAGLGQDSLILALLGCSVRMVERSPIVAALLADGLHRLEAIVDKPIDIQLIRDDAIPFLQQLSHDQYPDVIYLDPMYPEENKTAMSKREMQYLRELVGDDLDADELFAIALSRVKRRVVVKRSRIAPYLGGKVPHHQIKGKAARFDVYMINV